MGTEMISHRLWGIEGRTREPVGIQSLDVI